MNKMNPEIKAAWVAALRSGEYEQGVAALRAGDKFCCLGVLCDVAVEQYKLDITVEEAARGCSRECCSVSRPGLIMYDGEGSVLPDVVKDWAGMADNYGSLETYVFSPEGGVVGTLYSANDNGMSFSQIADIIEEQF